MAEKDSYYRLAYVYLKNQADSLDALQNMIVILYEDIGKLRKEESFYSWSKTILVNECKRMLRDKKRLVPISSMEEQVIEVESHVSEDRLLLEEYLGQLGHKHEEVIRLKYLLDLDYETIARLLHIPLGTVKSRLSLGMDKLRSLMEVEK